MRTPEASIRDIPQMMARYLMVTGDDYGYSVERNRGVAECYVRGAITRASLLVNGVAATQAVTLAQSLKMPLGLHMNLTEGHPVCAASDVSTLLGTDGYFLGKFGFRKQLKRGSLTPCQIEAEMVAQISRFRSLTGSLPLFVDGHQHVHVLPGIRDLFAKVLHSFKITVTRLPLEPLIARCHWIEEPRKNFYADVVHHSQHSRAVFDKHGLRYTDTFIGMSTQGADMTCHRLCSRLYSAFTFVEEREDNPIECQHVNTGATIDRNEHGTGNPVSTSFVRDTVCDSLYPLPYQPTDGQASEDPGDRRKMSTSGVSQTSEARISRMGVAPCSARLSPGSGTLMIYHSGNESPMTDKCLVSSSQQKSSLAHDGTESNDRTHLIERSESSDVERTSCSNFDIFQSLLRDDIDYLGVCKSNPSMLSSSHESVLQCTAHNSGLMSVETLVSSGTGDREFTTNVTKEWVTCELMVHPGYPCLSPDGGCGAGPDDFARSSERQHEMDILTCLMLQNFYKENNIQLVSALP